MIAEFESDLVRSRTREGMQVAKAKGQLRGKQPKLTKSQEAHLISLHRGGQHTTTEIAELFKVARSTMYRTALPPLIGQLRGVMRYEKRMLGAIGIVLLGVGSACTAIGLFQPGLACAGKDSSAGCPATPFYSGMLALGLLLLIVSILFIIRAARAEKLPPLPSAQP